jgi:hypothetical protein
MNFMTKKEFGDEVEKIAHETGLSYMDSILHLCDREGIDPEDARKFISPVIKGKLEAEAKRLHFLPKGSELENFE